MDACLHPVFLTLPNGGREPLVPVALARLCVYGQPGTTAFSHVRVTRASDTSVECDITVFDPSGEPVAAFGGLRLATIDLAVGKRSGGILY